MAILFYRKNLNIEVILFLLFKWKIYVFILDIFLSRCFSLCTRRISWGIHRNFMGFSLKMLWIFSCLLWRLLGFKMGPENKIGSNDQGICSRLTKVSWRFQKIKWLKHARMIFSSFHQTILFIFLSERCLYLQLIDSNNWFSYANFQAICSKINLFLHFVL